MQRLFAGTPWDKPPTCERCGRLETECACPPILEEPVRIAPELQTAKIRVEKRPKGKMVTIVGNLDPGGNDLTTLAATLKAKCGVGGTLKDDQIELQGDHRAKVETTLQGLGYKTQKR